MKKSLSLFIASSLLFSLFSCDQMVTHDVSPGKDGDVFVKLEFNNPDGSVDYSKVSVIPGDESGARTNRNIEITDHIVIPSADYPLLEYDAVTLRGGSITIVGDVTFRNPNSNNKGNRFDITVTKGNRLTIKSSLDNNGDLNVFNHGTIEAGNCEWQGAGVFENTGNLYITNTFQLSHADGIFRNKGFMVVGQTSSLHRGKFEFFDCGQLITRGMDINGSNLIGGKGSIEVAGNNFNLNHNLTESPLIEVVFGGHINQPSKLGSAKLVKDFKCVKDPLPVRYTNLKIERTPSAEKNTAQVSFDVTENSGLLSMRLLTSTDGKNWVSKFEEAESAFVAGKKYSRKFSL